MDPVNPQPTLLEAARTVARGRDLEAQLARLAELARTAGGAQSTAIQLLDPVGRRLVPAALAGGGDRRAEDAPTTALDDTTDLAAAAARERLTMAGSAELAIPLIIADDAGGEEVEGVLLATFAGSMPEAGGEDILTALADLAAVAIRRARLQHALVEKAEWIERLASTDPLTGIANRATFERMLELEIARATRQATPLSVVLLDIDDFAGLNQRSGAQAGDDAVRRVASLLADQVRLVDTIGRLGADEFGIIAPGGGGAVVARRVIAAAGGLSLSLGAGVAVMPEDGSSSAELLAAADAALAAAKGQGAGAVVGGQPAAG